MRLPHPPYKVTHLLTTPLDGSPRWKGLPRPTLKLLYACQTLFGTCRNILKFNRATKSFLSQCSMVIMYGKGYYIVDVAGTKKLSRWRKQEGCALRLLQMPLLELEQNSQQSTQTLRCLNRTYHNSLLAINTGKKWPTANNIDKPTKFSVKIYRFQTKFRSWLPLLRMLIACCKFYLNSKECFCIYIVIEWNVFWNHIVIEWNICCCNYIVIEWNIFDNCNWATAMRPSSGCSQAAMVPRKSSSDK